MITANAEMERRWREFQRSPVPCLVEAKTEQWGWVNYLNTAALLQRLARAFPPPPPKSNGESPTQGETHAQA